ncbi:MAG TPA: hypothetical protein VIG99_28635 [Myxococcaceae bacterium]|jgi:hypothetical protein
MKLAIGMLCVVFGSLALAGDAPRPQARNPHLPVIQKHLKGGDLDRAEAELRAAQAWKENTSVDLGQISILQGILSTLSANDEEAKAAFRRALALDPQAQLPEAANEKVRAMFEQARADARSAVPEGTATKGQSSGRNLPAEMEQQWVKGDLKSAETLLEVAGAQPGLSDWESGQVNLLQAMQGNLRSLQEKKEPAYYRSAADDLEASEARLGEETSQVQLPEAAAAQVLSLRTSMLVVCGMLRLQSGEEKRAVASFRKALALNPRARLPAVATAKMRRAFEEAKGKPR